MATIHTRTLPSIEKLAGMTGTAKSEERRILINLQYESCCYSFTNRPVARKDLPDEIYAHKKDKYAALVREVKRLYETRTTSSSWYDCG